VNINNKFLYTRLLRPDPYLSAKGLFRFHVEYNQFPSEIYRKVMHEQLRNPAIGDWTNA